MAETLNLYKDPVNHVCLMPLSKEKMRLYMRARRAKERKKHPPEPRVKKAAPVSPEWVTRVMCDHCGKYVPLNDWLVPPHIPPIKEEAAPEAV
jgi:hypothetical protein